MILASAVGLLARASSTLVEISFAALNGSVLGHMLSRCSTEQYSSHSGHCLLKLAVFPKLCVALVWPERSLETTRCSRQSCRSSHAIVEGFTFLMNSERLANHAESHVFLITLEIQCLMSWAGTLFVKRRPCLPKLAILSASSLPGIPTWEGTHINTVLWLTMLVMAWIQGCFWIWLLSASRALAESVMIRVGRSDSVDTAAKRAAASAEKMEHCFGSR